MSTFKSVKDKYQNYIRQGKLEIFFKVCMTQIFFYIPTFNNKLFGFDKMEVNSFQISLIDVTFTCLKTDM